MNNDKTKGRSVRMSGTPIVRQYGILLMRWMIFYVKRNTEQEIHRRIQAKGSGDDGERLRHNEEERKLGLPHGPAASWERSILKNARKDCTSNRGCSVSQGAHTGLDPYRSASFKRNICETSLISFGLYFANSQNLFAIGDFFVSK